MKTILLLMVLAVLVTGEGRAADSTDPTTMFKPTWKGDEHMPPVYTSPTNGLPPNQQWSDTNMPTRTNWPYPKMPALTNWPSTNQIPAITNSPPYIRTNPPPSLPTPP